MKGAVTDGPAAGPVMRRRTTVKNIPEKKRLLRDIFYSYSAMSYISFSESSQDRQGSVMDLP